MIVCDEFEGIGLMKMVHEVGEFWFEFWWKENGEKKRRKENFEVKSEKVRVA